MEKQFGFRQQKQFTTILWMMIGVFVLCMGKTVHAQNGLSLTGKISGYQSVQLKWQADSVDSVYQIERSNSANGIFKIVQVASGQKGLVSLKDNSVEYGKTYYYKVVKLVENQVVEESGIIKMKITLPRPVHVTAKKIKESKIKLSWDKVKGSTGYIIYRSKTAEKGFKKIGTVTKTEFTDASVNRGACYYYKIAAVKKKIKGDVSKEVSLCLKPETPKVEGHYSKKKIKVTWKKAEGADTYYIYKKDSKGKYKKLGETGKLYYTDKKVKKGKSYEYKVAAAYSTNDKTMKSSMSTVCKVLAAGVDPNKKMIALTFDDGPGRYTKEIVSCLKKNNAKATFFVIGSQVESYKSVLQAADKIGCEIGNHTYDHKNLTKLSVQEIREQVSKTDKKVKKAIGKSPALLRTPGGAISSTVNQTVAKPIILWSIDTRDWETRDTDKTIKAVMGHVKDGDIILMHDIYKPTKEAACNLIPGLQREGYQLVTVSELAKYRGYKLKKGSIYHSLRRKN